MDGLSKLECCYMYNVILQYYCVHDVYEPSEKSSVRSGALYRSWFFMGVMGRSSAEIVLKRAARCCACVWELSNEKRTLYDWFTVFKLFMLFIVSWWRVPRARRHSVRALHSTGHVFSARVGQRMASRCAFDDCLHLVVVVFVTSGDVTVDLVFVFSQSVRESCK